MVSYEYESLFHDGSVRKNLILTDGTLSVSNNSIVATDETIRITNSDLHSESFFLDESICSEQSLAFGACESATMSARFSAYVVPLKDKVLNVYMYLDGDVNTLMQIGTYKAESDKASADRLSRTIEAHDLMYDILNADVSSWYSSLFSNSSSVSIGDMRSSLCSQFGITVDGEGINDSITVTRQLSGTIKGSTILKAITQLSGGFGHIGRDGKFRTICLPQSIEGLYPSADLYPSDDLFPHKPKSKEVSRGTYIPPLRSESYFVAEITGVRIKDYPNDVGVLAGTDTNVYEIVGNPLVFGMSSSTRSTVASNILSKISGITYHPYSVTAQGNPCIEVGDAIRLSSTSQRLETYVLRRTLSGIQSLRDKYSADGTESLRDVIPTTNERINLLSQKTVKMEASMDGIELSVTNLAAETSAQFLVVDGQISSKVSTSTFNSTVTQLGNAIDAKVSTSDYTTEVALLEGEIDLCVTKAGVVSDLNNGMGSSIVITANAMYFNSTGSIIINTSDFTLDADGNATFAGTLAAGISISAPVISGGSFECDGLGGTVTVENGSIVIDDGDSSYMTINPATGISFSVSGDTVAYVNWFSSYFSRAVVDSFKCEGKEVSWQQMTIGGTTYNVLVGA